MIGTYPLFICVEFTPHKLKSLTTMLLARVERATLLPSPHFTLSRSLRISADGIGPFLNRLREELAEFSSFSCVSKAHSLQLQSEKGHFFAAIELMGGLLGALQVKINQVVRAFGL
jgi:hypothetical protein